MIVVARGSTTAASSTTSRFRNRPISRLWIPNLLDPCGISGNFFPAPPDSAPARSSEPAPPRHSDFNHAAELIPRCSALADESGLWPMQRLAPDNVPGQFREPIGKTVGHIVDAARCSRLEISTSMPKNGSGANQFGPSRGSPHKPLRKKHIQPPANRLRRRSRIKPHFEFDCRTRRGRVRQKLWRPQR